MTPYLAALPLLLIGAGPALALERSGTTTIAVEGQPDRQRSFTMAYDPATGAFTREGKIDLRRGRSITYRMEGTCKAGAGCAWTGTGTGPAGGRWTGEGDVKRTSERETVATGTLRGPGGRIIKITRTIAGDDFIAAMAAGKAP